MHYVVAAGNYLMGDDSIGPLIIDAIEDRELDNSFLTDSIAHDSLRLLSYFKDSTDRLLLIDAVSMDLEPGDWRIFSPVEIQSHKKLSGTTTHESDLLRTILLAEKVDLPVPDIRILGIQPAAMSPGAGLSEALAKRLDEYIMLAIKTVHTDWPSEQ
jgi:hydrogenase maturation protease